MNKRWQINQADLQAEDETGKNFSFFVPRLSG